MDVTNYKEKLEQIKQDTLSGLYMLKIAVVTSVLLYKEVKEEGTEDDAMEAIVNIFNEAIDLNYVPEFLEAQIIRATIKKVLALDLLEDIRNESVDNIIKDIEDTDE